MRRYLVVGNETLDSGLLLDRLGELASGEASEFHVLVPASHPRGAWTDAMIEAAASARLTEILARWRGMGWTVTGETGEASPHRAIGDVLLRDRGFDAIVLSTHPPGISRWLHHDVVHRVERDYPLPVIHVVAVPEPAR